MQHSEPTKAPTAESGHWYDYAKQEQVQLVAGKSGVVKPDLRHARKLMLAPGVTTIIREAHKEALVRYRERQVLLAALTLPRLPGESEDSYVTRIMADSKAAAMSAADQGSDIHARIETGLRNPLCQDPWVVAARNKLSPLMPDWQAWDNERAVVHPYGFGTKSDLSHGGPAPVVVDIKTKDSLDDLKLWPEHYQQLAATRAALAHASPQFETATCGILFVSRTAPDAMLVMAEEDQLSVGWNTFLALLFLWQQRNRYAPDWAHHASLSFRKP